MTPTYSRQLDFGLPDQPSLDLLLAPVGVALDVDRRQVLKDPIQDGRGDHRVAEDLDLLADAAVRGEEQGTLLTASRDELEEQMGAVPVDGDCTPLGAQQADVLPVDNVTAGCQSRSFTWS